MLYGNMNPYYMPQMMAQQMMYPSYVPPFQYAMNQRMQPGMMMYPQMMYMQPNM